MVVQVGKSKVSFARRLNAAMDACVKVPKGRQRRSWVAKRYGVSIESARKWLVGESIPRTSLLSTIAKDIGANMDSLLTGRQGLLASPVQDNPATRISDEMLDPHNLDTLTDALAMLENALENTDTDTFDTRGKAELLCMTYEALRAGDTQASIERTIARVLSVIAGRRAAQSGSRWTSKKKSVSG